MLEDLLPHYEVLAGTKQAGIDLDPDERRKQIIKRRVYLSRYGRISLDEIKQLPLGELHRLLQAVGKVIGEENAMSSLNERT